MIDPERILAIVADVFGVSIADIRGRRRFARITQARHAAAYLLAERGLGRTEIGEILGRNWSTISTSIAVATQLAKDDRTYAARLRVCLAACDPAPPREAPAPKPHGAWVVAPAIHVSMFFWGVPDVPSA